MKNYILHIGLPKTGTTALQAYYFPRLESSSVGYNPPSIVQPLVEALKLLDFEMLTRNDLQLLKEVVASQSERIAQRTILISLEILSQRLGRFNFIERANFLKSIFPNARIVLVLRYQPALLRSLYLQFLHQNYFLTPEEVFLPFARQAFPETDMWKKNMQIDIKEWNYTEAIKYLRDIYNGQFRIYFYERFSKNLADLGKMVFSFSNQKHGDLPSGPLPRVNVSYDSLTAHLALYLSLVT